MEKKKLLPMKDISLRTNKLRSLYVFDQMSQHSNVKDGKCLQFREILNV
jgi:hypothetical protein